MLLQRLKNSGNEAGYSLVEVVASIIILTIAILPMVGMFDAGLRAASTSGNYDRARSLANLVLEQAKGRGYDAVKASYPNGACALDAADTDGNDACSSVVAPSGFPASFTYTVEKQYLTQSPTGVGSDAVSSPEGFAESNSATDTKLIRLTVTVNWSGNTYETRAVVAG